MRAFFLVIVLALILGLAPLSQASEEQSSSVQALMQGQDWMGPVVEMGPGIDPDA